MSAFRVNPSGKRHIDEMREFAAEMNPDIGPCFGRDVVMALDELDAAVKALRKLAIWGPAPDLDIAQEMREFAAAVLAEQEKKQP